MEQFLHTLIKEAGVLALTYFDKEFEVSQKSGMHDLLTDADTTVNKYITTAIKDAYPTHAITSEEEGFHPGESEYEWIVDPIEGTYSFAHAVPLWAVMITLLHDNKPQYSAIYWPVTDQLFYANSKGAFVNEKQVSVTGNTKELKDAFTSAFAGKPSGEYGREYERYLTAKKRLAGTATAGSRHLGCSGALCYILTGFMDVGFGNWGLDWDYITPFYILQQGGAIVTDSYGNPWERGRQDYVVAANESLHAELLTLFK